MISDESKLHCGCEAGFRQATSYRIHCFSGGGNLALSHSSGTKKEWKALNLRGFPKIECCHDKLSLSFTFYEGNIEHGGRA